MTVYGGIGACEKKRNFRDKNKGIVGFYNSLTGIKTVLQYLDINLTIFKLLIVWYINSKRKIIIIPYFLFIKYLTNC